MGNTLNCVEICVIKIKAFCSTNDNDKPKDSQLKNHYNETDNLEKATNTNRAITSNSSNNSNSDFQRSYNQNANSSNNTITIIREIKTLANPVLINQNKIPIVTPKKYEELYCKYHNKYFKNKNTYDEHMSSKAHNNDYHDYDDYDDYYNDRDNNDNNYNYDNSDNNNYNLDYLPKPVTTEGRWVPREVFEGKKSFGYFKCLCEKW